MPDDNDEGLDPELEDALNSVDNGDEEPYFEDAKENGEEEPPAVDAAAVVPEKRKGGRPRKNAPRHVASEPIAPQAASRRESPPERDMKAIWDDIVERVRDRGFGGPEAVSISVIKHVIGPNREAPVALNTISGESVAGSQFRSPGEDLQDYLERAYHVPSGSGPAMYRLRFTLRGAPKNDRFLGSAEVVLQSANDIRKQWAAAAEIRRERERDADFSPLRADPRSAFGGTPRAVSSFEVGPTTAADHPTVAPQGPAPGGGGTDMTMMFMKYLMDQNAVERREAIRRGEQPPVMQLPPEIARLVGGAPQAAAPQAPTVTLEERVARTVIETLKAMGITPQQPQIVAGVPVPPAPPSLTGPVVQTAVTAPMNAAKEFFTQMREFKKMEADMREMFAPEEEDEPAVVPPAPTVLAAVPEEDEYALKPVNETFVRFEGDPVMFSKQAESETTFQWLMRLGTGNPKIIGKVLEKGMQVLDQGTLGKLIAALAPQGPPQPGPPRGLPNGAPVPQAPQPQSNGTAGGWTPHVG